MSIDYSMRFIRITTSDKIADRFITCQVHKALEESSSMGDVLSLIEILNPWFPTSQIGQTMINILIREYYRSESTSDLENFENALQKVNEALVQITQEGETDWIGNLNAVLGVVNQNQLHLSQTGKAKVLLFRDNQVSHVTEETAASEPHPLHTFSNITSGTLNLGDKILIASPGFFENFTLPALNNIMSAKKISEAAVEIVKKLQKTRIKNVNLLIFAITAKKVAEPNFKDTFYLDQPLESASQILIKILTKYIWPAVRFVFKSIYKALAKIGRFVSKKIFSKVRAIKKSQQPPQESPQTLPANANLGYKITHYEQQKTKKNYFAFLGRFFSKIAKIFKFLKAKENRSIAFVALAAVCLLVLVIALNLNKSQHKLTISESQARQTIEQATNTLKQANISLSVGDKAQAQKLLVDSITKAREVKDYPLAAQDSARIISQAQEKLDELVAIKRLSNLKEKANFSGSALIFESGNGIYTVDPKTNKIYRASLIDGRVGQVAELPSKEGTIKTSTLFAQNKSILLYTSLQKMFQYKIDTMKIEPVTIKDNKPFENAQNIFTYFSNIYLLDPASSQIYKHSFVDNEYLPGSVYTSSQTTDLTTAVSFAIDGDLYILNAAGDVTKLSRGRKVDFKISDIPEPDATIKQPLKIYTDSEAKSIYILDAGLNRILAFAKDDSKYVQQFIFEGLNIKDFTLNLKAKKLWALADNKLYEIEL